MKILNKSFCLIVLLSLSLVFSPLVVRAQDEDEEDSVINEESTSTEQAKTESSESEETAPVPVAESLSSPFAKTKVLFVQPESTDLPAGRLVKVLVGFQNNGTSSFFIDSIDGSFRYPQDFSYYIQNFTVFDYRKIVESDREATFEYLFTPSETFSSRQFGLTINLRYKDLDGKQFISSVFNDTINVVEPDEGLDGETFLLYIFLAAIVVLLAIGAQQFFTVFKKKGRGIKASVQKLSNGGQATSSTNSDGIDLEWIPKEHLQTNKSPKQSPRQRKVKNGAAASSSGNSSNDER